MFTRPPSACLILEKTSLWASFQPGEVGALPCQDFVAMGAADPQRPLVDLVLQAGLGLHFGLAADFFVDPRHGDKDGGADFRQRRS